MFNVGDKVTLKDSNVPMTIDQIGTKLEQTGVWFMVSWETQEGDQTITNSDWYPEALFKAEDEAPGQVGAFQANHGEFSGNKKEAADHDEVANNEPEVKDVNTDGVDDSDKKKDQDNKE